MSAPRVSDEFLLDTLRKMDSLINNPARVEVHVAKETLASMVLELIQRRRAEREALS